MLCKIINTHILEKIALLSAVAGNSQMNIEKQYYTY